MKLYYSPGACSLAPHIVLEEISAPYQTVLISTVDGSTSTQEYLKINAKGKVPVLITSNEILTEASAILLYLALSNPQCNLILNTPLGLARAIEWTNWLSSIHSFVIAQNWRTERFSDDTTAYSSIRVKGMKNLHETYSLIDTKLKNVIWAVEDSYSIVDPYLLVFFRWGNRLGLEMREFKHWTMHAKKMEQRAAVRSVLKAENISIWQ